MGGTKLFLNYFFTQVVSQSIEGIDVFVDLTVQRILEFSKSRETLKTAVLWNVFCFNFSYAFLVTNAHFIREFYDNSATN